MSQEGERKEMKYTLSFHAEGKNAFKLLPISGDILIVFGLIQKSGCWQILLKETKYENRQACERDIV